MASTTPNAVCEKTGQTAHSLEDGATPADPESTLSLLTRARSGDHDALDRLFARYVPRLRRWARGRLPRSARDMADTNDLVQDTLLQTFKKVDTFEYRGEGALQAYLRQVLVNRIRGELRTAARRATPIALDDAHIDPGPSPLEAAVSAEMLAEYDRALERLRPQDREAIVARVEMGLTYAELAVALGKRSDDAARKITERALVRLVEAMEHEA